MKKITVILVLFVFISIFNLNSRSFLAQEDYVIDENQSIDEDFIVEGDVKITGGAVVSFSNCRVEVFGNFIIKEDSKVLFKNCRIGEAESHRYQYFGIDKAQLTLDNCIVNVDISPREDSNILIKDSECNYVQFDSGVKTKMIIESSNIDSLRIYMSNITIENLNQGFISKYNLKNNNSELIVLDSTIDHIDLWNDPWNLGGDIKIKNVNCNDLIIHISDEEEGNIEISNLKTEMMITVPFKGTINIDKIKQGFNSEAEIYSENGKFHLRIIESEISKWTLQTTGDPTVNVRESIITSLVPGGNSIINFVQSETPNKILESLECIADAINPTIKGSVLIDDTVEIDMLGAIETGGFIRENFKLTRYYPAFIKYENKPLENISVKILENGEEIWSGYTDTEGYVEPVIAFKYDNINSEFKIKLEYDGLSYSKDISLKTSTPLVFDEQVLVPEFGQVKDNKILIYGSSIVIIFIVVLILVYCLKKKK